MRFHLGYSLTPFFAIALSLSVHAKPKIHLGVDREMFINYTSSEWNTDSEKVDSGHLFFKDAASGRIVQIQLEETEPDSAKFIGQFSITWADASQISPEIYIPSQDTKTKGQQQMLQLISSGKVARKPIIVRKNELGQSTIEVFDQRADAEKAWKGYQAELKERSRKLIKPVPSEQSLAAADQAEHSREMKELAQIADARERDRKKLAATELEKQNARLAKFGRLSPAQQAAQKAKGKQAWDRGMADYGTANYAGAEAKFKEAIEDDPTQKSYYFNEGVALYRLEKLDNAMVALRMAPDDPKTANEKKYYMGLIHLKLKELDPALKYFNEVGDSKDPVMAPSALYYKGVLLFSDGKFEESKKPFEDVIDLSQDPKLDQQAEDYLDKIAQAIAFKKMQDQKWNLSGTVGLFYDSNVLLATDFQQAQGTSTRQSDVRMSTMATLEYRPLFTEHQELSLKGTGNLTNSSNASISVADPWIYTFEVPWSYKGILWGKGYKLTARVGYEMLYMALTANSPKRDIMNSTYLSVDNTFVMHPNWFATYTLQYRFDGSQLNFGDPGYSSPDDNASSNQYYLKTSQIFLLDKSKQEAFIATGGIVNNTALGMNRTYDRLEIGAMYARPISSFAWNLGLNYYYLTYPGANPTSSYYGRVDNNYVLSTGVSKPINDWFTWGVNANYTTNGSTQSDSFQYSKFMIMTTASFNTGF